LCPELEFPPCGTVLAKVDNFPTMGEKLTYNSIFDPSLFPRSW
jgi:hypothetical protein